MSSIIRHLTLTAAVLSLVALEQAGAQTVDTTQTDRRPEVRGRMRRGMVEPQPGGRYDVGPRGRRFMNESPLGMRTGARLGARPDRGGLMRGITLSADQERALRTNQSRHLQATKPLLVEIVSARADEELARLNGDQKALDAAAMRHTTARTRLDSLRSGRSTTAELRSVLTPDQQKLLDRNLSELANRGPRPFGPRFQRGAPGARMREGGMREGLGARGFGPRAFRPDERAFPRPRRGERNEPADSLAREPAIPPDLR